MIDITMVKQNTPILSRSEEDNVDVVYKYADGALERAVDEQVTLPNQAYDELHHAVFLTEDYQARDSMEDLNG